MNSVKLKTILFATPEFCLPTFEALHQHHDLVAVVTAPDKPVGRQQVLTPSPIKARAQVLGKPVFTPESLKNNDSFYAEIKALHTDAIIVFAYGQIIPPEILHLPKYGCINIHPSLLPKYRGATPLHAALLNGDNRTGITTMQMDEGMDTGSILEQFPLNLDPNETGASLHEKASTKAAKAIISTLAGIKGITPKPQKDAQATYCYKIKKPDGHLTSFENADEIRNKIHAYHIWPGTYVTLLDKKTLKLFPPAETKLAEIKKPAGTLEFKENEAWLHCGDSAVVVKEVQLAGKKKTTVKEFRQGYPDYQITKLPDY